MTTLFASYAPCNICHRQAACRLHGVELICNQCWTACEGKPARLTKSDRAYLREKAAKSGEGAAT